MSRDVERIREFADKEAQLHSAEELLEIAKVAVGLAKGKAPMSVHTDMDVIRRQIGGVKADLNNEVPGMKLKQGGAKHSIVGDDGYGDVSCDSGGGSDV